MKNSLITLSLCFVFCFALTLSVGAQTAPATASATPMAAAATTPAGPPPTRFELEKAAFDAAFDQSLEQPIVRGIDMASRNFTRRLPNFYRTVVTVEQRDEIYRIQEEFHPLITFLTLRLEQLRAEQNARIQAVLTPAQREEVRRASGQ